MNFPKINPQTHPEYQALARDYQALKKRRLTDLFADNPKRAQDFFWENDYLYYDYSKQFLTSETLRLWERLADSCAFSEAQKAFRTGRYINETEHRQVLHFALRDLSGTFKTTATAPAYASIQTVRLQMKTFVEKIHEKKCVGCTGKPFDSFIHIGIGGSDLGPKMAATALTPFQRDKKTCFVANADGTQLREALEKTDPERTLLLIASKTFTTQETMHCAQQAKQWLIRQLGSEPEVLQKHLVALTANTEKALAFGLSEAHIFPFGDFVGGRYSVWSSIGLTVALHTGWSVFEGFLKGAHQADRHFFHTPLSRNIPFIMAVLGIGYRHFFHYAAHCVLTYQYHLRYFTDYLQQLSMESNGKHTDRNGQPLPYPSHPVLFGGSGTEVQHSFFQQLHQGTDPIPTDFIACLTHPQTDMHSQNIQLSHLLAQTHALMAGKSNPGSNPYQSFPGNKPSSIFLLKTLCPESVGFLMALYEHKIFTEGALLNIYSFDQFGVELGKEISARILSDLQNNTLSSAYDPATCQLIQRIQASRK